MNIINKIAVIGLGYVGLPLARLFATKYPVIGFDINQARIDELNSGHDKTLEVDDDILQAVLVSSSVISVIFERSEGSNTLAGQISASSNTLARQASQPESSTSSEASSSSTISDLPVSPSPVLEVNKPSSGLFCSSSLNDIKYANFYIITVPTPVDKHNKPDLTPLYKASETVGKVLKKGDIVIYESTVYPGATEEECVPVLERVSGLKFNEDFFAGYSPERINPGDKERTVEKILKITSGSTPEIGIRVDELYKSVIPAGTHLAPSIKVAEAAKVIENSQRDINIAFVNELAKIFNILDIDTHAVLEAAGTKWNFLPFKPGLVGGHCIGVDPYYLAQKAQEHGYHPEIILAGRRLNDSMGAYVASEVVKCMIKKGINVSQAEVLILGITFKENCPDVRNTRVVDVISALKDYGVKVNIYDPWANPKEVMREYGLKLETSLIPTVISTEAERSHSSNTPADHSSPSNEHRYDAVVLTVAHKEFLEMNISNLQKEVSVLYDVKGILGEKCDGRL